jgi:hypothetical protein
MSGQAQTAFAAIARHRLVLLVDGGVHLAGCRRDVEGMHRIRAAMGAHFTRVFFRMQTIFSHPATNGRQARETLQGLQTTKRPKPLRRTRDGIEG